MLVIDEETAIPYCFIERNSPQELDQSTSKNT